MDNIRMIFNFSFQNFRKWMSNPRIYMIGILLILYIFNTTIPISKFCQTVQVSISPWYFPFLTSDQWVIPILFSGLILLFCDAPFIDQSQPYNIIRSGRKKWIAGQLLYIFFASIIYFLFILIISTLLLLPVTRWQTDWGRVLNTLATTTAQSEFHIPITFHQKIILLYNPIQALGISFLMNILVGTFIGLLIFVINLRFNRILGCIIAAIPTLLTNTIFFNEFFLVYYIPVSWVSLIKLDPTGKQLLPSVTYASIVILALIAILSIISFLGIKRKPIEVSSQI
ncbi:MAG: hypothetical protein HFJ84_10960 [Clostridiales bacterium]|jgi:hypothetical protein|nr:hypothetical protein [Clostridiales bacterium]